MGVSWLDQRATDRAYDDVDEFDEPVTNAFTGTSKTWIADATLKWAPHGDPTQHQLKLQGEYMHRTESGALAFDVTGQNLSGAYDSVQSGWYIQAVYEFMQRWRAGLRYDSLDSGHPDIGLVTAGVLPLTAFPALLPATPDRTTFMVDWSLSRVLAPARPVRLGRGARRRRTRPAAAAAIHLLHRRPRRPQVLGSPRNMPRFIRLLSVLAALWLLAAAVPAQAALKVLATTPDWASLTTELGGDKVNVYTATSAFQDVHRVDAKPSLVARARSADLVVATGAELEIGWMPVLLQDSGNSKIQPGSPGYFEAAPLVHLLEVPSAVDRSMGDIHPLGNPHVSSNPHNIAIIAAALSARAWRRWIPPTRPFYQQRGADFQKRWTAATAKWEAQAAPLKGVGVVVIHRDQAYLCHWLGLKELAAIEPKPGVPPSAGYLAELVTKLGATPPKMILRNAYNDPKAADWLAERIHAPVVLLPYSVGGTPEAKDLFGLFDDTVNRLLAAAK